MGPRCAVTSLILALLAGATSAAADKSAGPDPAGRCSNVKNAPFSAEVITEYDRTLDNGGRIHRESRGAIFRDSQGRMRTENQPSALQPGSEKADRITINDPIQQVIIYLNPKTKTATVVRFSDAEPNPPAVAAKPAKAKGKSKIRLAGQPGTGPSDTLSETNPGGGAGNLPPSQGIPTSRMDATIFANTPATIVPLGTRNIEGVSATGTRTTRTINPGTMGNDKPIVSISDTWVATDLKVTVLSETDDGQEGHSTMKLVNIVRGEPNSALFLIPVGYKVKENALAASALH
jgi:hypothetical protein